MVEFSRTIIYPSCSDESRLDLFLQQEFPSYSRTFLQKKIKIGQVQVEGKNVKVSYRLTCGENISLNFTAAKESCLTPEPLPLNIVFEDSHLIVVNKAAGLVTHPAPSCREPTLVNALLYHCKDLAGIGGEKRPGIVHRLDKDTSGLIVVAKDDRSYSGLKSQWENRTIKREYHAFCLGPWRAPIIEVDAPIGRHPKNRKKMAVTEKNSRPAQTTFTMIEDLGEFVYVKAVLKTGRTHQIRVHLSYLKHPLIGDQLYGGDKLKKMLPRQALHAHRLGFTHPITAKFIDLYADLPDDLVELHERLRQNLMA